MEKTVLVQPEIDKLNIRIDADGWGQYGGNAWFDDLKIEKLDMSQNEIVSETNYYPFGLAHKGYNEHVNSTNKGEDYKFNGKELNDEMDLGWYDFGARPYMPDINRTTTIDPLADDPTQIDKSPYAMFWNNPMKYVDPTGMIPVYALDKQSRENIINQLRPEDRKYVQFDSDGKLNTDRLSLANSDSGNLKNLRTLAESETTYTFSSSDKAVYKNGNTGDANEIKLVSSNERNGTKGITLFPNSEKAGKTTQLSMDENVNIIVNNKSSNIDAAKTTAHEIVHGVFFEKGEVNPNHQYGIVGQDKDGTFVLGDTNKALNKEIKAREEEVLKNNR